MPLIAPWSSTAVIDEASSWFEKAKVAARGARVEVFVRASIRLRATHTGHAVETLEGTERGVAVRVRELRRNGEGFAAATFGSDATTAEWLTRRAAEDARHAPPGTGAWREEPVERDDLDTVLDLPSPEGLASWLERAWGFLVERVRDADRASPLPTAWVETAASTEVLLDDLGTRAVRTRRRAWAMALCRGRALPDAPERPRFLVGREFAELDAGTWAEDFDESPGPTRLPERPPPLPWLLTPQAAASLIPALVTVLHGSSRTGGTVGAGWSVHDDPLHDRGLVGGAFDDLGFEAGRLVLASEGQLRRPLAGPGTFRRPSFRDRPAPYPTTLVLTPPSVGRPERYYRIQGLRLHPLDEGRWVLELDGVRREADATGEAFQGARAVVHPKELVECCIGGVGEARLAAWGVVTPRLVFEGLRLE